MSVQEYSLATAQKYLAKGTGWGLKTTLCSASQALPSGAATANGITVFWSTLRADGLAQYQRALSQVFGSCPVDFAWPTSLTLEGSKILASPLLWMWKMMMACTPCLFRSRDAGELRILLALILERAASQTVPGVRLISILVAV